MIKTHWKFIILCFILLTVMIFRFRRGLVQQDNYVGYAQALSYSVNKISFFDSRLFPGLPVIIFSINLILNNFLLSGYLAVFLAFLGSYVILYKLTGSRLSLLPLIFPPVMLNQATLIATELPAIFFILLSLYLFKKERFVLAVLISAFGFWVRPIAIIPSLVILIYLFIKNGRKAFRYLPYFFFPLILLVLFNSYFFGSQNLFCQFTAYRAFGVNTLGIAQIFSDIPRAWRWGWFRIFASGVFYFFLSLYFLTASFREFRKENDTFKKVIFFILLGSLIFVYSLTSVPFLENLGRYLAPVVPLFWIIFYDKFKDPKWVYLLLPLSFVVVLV